MIPNLILIPGLALLLLLSAIKLWAAHLDRVEIEFARWAERGAW